MPEAASGGDSSQQMISDEEIAARAFQIYEREGRQDGRDMEHWLRAESELRAERQNMPAMEQTAPRSARRHQPESDSAQGAREGKREGNRRVVGQPTATAI